MAELVQIGNSMGVRIPKPLIKQAGLEGKELRIRVISKGILITPVVRRHVREGWAEACKAMHEAGDDKPLLNETDETEFDRTKWKW